MDPWAAMRAAVHRITAGGDVLGPDERISAEQALRLFLGHPDRPSVPRTVDVGQPGDLMVLTPTRRAWRRWRPTWSPRTIVGGRVS